MARTSQPTIDLYPWPNGLGFSGAEEWWLYVRRQTEEDKLDLLITIAHLSDPISELLLTHDEELLNRFQFSGYTLERLISIRVDSLQELAAVLIEQNHARTVGYINDD